MVNHLSIDWSISELCHLNFRRYPPSPPLRPFIQCYWSLHPDSPTMAPVREKLYPDAGSGLIFDFGLNPDTPVQFSFCSQPHEQIITRESRRFGIRFMPGGAAHLLGIDLGMLDVVAIPASDLAIPELSTLYHQIADSSPSRRAHLAENWLLQQLNKAGRHDTLIQYALHNLTAAPAGTGSLSRTLGIGRRLLERRFRSRIGLSPQQLRRIVQLRQARFMIKRAPEAIRLTDIAVDCGFYDQAHFIRAFTRHTGMTPGAYRQRQLTRQAAGELQVIRDNPSR